MTKRKTAVIVGIVGLLLLVGGGVWAVSSGRIAIVWKQPKEIVVIDVNTCNQELIDRYNAIFSAPAADASEYEAKLQAIDSEVADLPGSNEDVSCLYIRYTAAIQQKDYDRAREYTDSMKTIAEQSHGQVVTAKVLKQFQPSTLEENLKHMQAADAANESQDSDVEPAIPAQGGQG